MIYRLGFLGSIVIFFASLGVANATENIFEANAPKIFADVTMQAEKFYGDHFNSFIGYTTPVNRYSVRHAKIGVMGSIGEHIEYEVAAGSATCLAGGQFTLMDAEIFYKPFEFLRLGFIKGEIMRGFEFREECVNVLTAEKPRFATTIAPCHPTGAAVDFDYSFSGPTGLSVQFAYLNGTVTQNLDDEKDINLGVIFHTPYQGLSIGGFYNDIRKNYGPDEDFVMVNDKGQRMGFGLDYDADNILFRGEYYLLKGYYNNPFVNTCYRDDAQTQYIPSADLEMDAFYIEGGYTLNTNLESLPSIRPYLRYQSWDKASNAAGDNIYAYVTVGVSLVLDEHHQTLFRIDYDTPVTTPDNVDKDSELLIIRFQTSIF